MVISLKAYTHGKFQALSIVWLTIDIIVYILLITDPNLSISPTPQPQATTIMLCFYEFDISGLHI